MVRLGGRLGRSVGFVQTPVVGNCSMARRATGRCNSRHQFLASTGVAVYAGLASDEKHRLWLMNDWAPYPE